jgi:sortase A
VLNGSTPGAESGNVVLAAHNDIYGELFEHLPDMEVGDQFQIQTSSATYTYEVEEAYEVDPDEVWVMDVTPGESRATLITCYPYGVNTDRWIVFARRVDANA